MRDGREKIFMRYKAFFDTNILAYEFDRSENEKQSLAMDLINKWRPSGRMIISTQVLQESYISLTRILTGCCSNNFSRALQNPHS